MGLTRFFAKFSLSTCGEVVAEFSPVLVEFPVMWSGERLDIFFLTTTSITYMVLSQQVGMKI